MRIPRRMTMKLLEGAKEKRTAKSFGEDFSVYLIMKKWSTISLALKKLHFLLAIQPLFNIVIFSHSPHALRLLFRTLSYLPSLPLPSFSDHHRR
jgi:hypothetical protein